MSRGFSRVVLVGNLGRDPEMRYSQNGMPITNFSLAVNRRRRQQDGSYQDETDWYRVSLYRQQAENAAEWLQKGNRGAGRGTIAIRNYTGQDGVERTSIEVDADNFQNLTRAAKISARRLRRASRAGAGRATTSAVPPASRAPRPPAAATARRGRSMIWMTSRSRPRDALDVETLEGYNHGDERQPREGGDERPERSRDRTPAEGATGRAGALAEAVAGRSFPAPQVCGSASTASSMSTTRTSRASGASSPNAA